METSIKLMSEKDKRGKNVKYADTFKRKIAEEYLSSTHSCSQIQELYDLPSRHTVYSFVRWYKKKYDVTSISLKELSNTALKTQKENDLEQMLHYAKLKIESLETMIDIAEKSFDIDIRKKSGTKSSEK